MTTAAATFTYTVFFLVVLLIFLPPPPSSIFSWPVVGRWFWAAHLTVQGHIYHGDIVTFNSFLSNVFGEFRSYCAEYKLDASSLLLPMLPLLFRQAAARRALGN